MFSGSFANANSFGTQQSPSAFSQNFVQPSSQLFNSAIHSTFRQNQGAGQNSLLNNDNPPNTGTIKWQETLDTSQLEGRSKTFLSATKNLQCSLFRYRCGDYSNSGGTMFGTSPSNTNAVNNTFGAANTNPLWNANNSSNFTFAQQSTSPANTTTNMNFFNTQPNTGAFGTTSTTNAFGQSTTNTLSRPDVFNTSAFDSTNNSTNLFAQNKPTTTNTVTNLFASGTTANTTSSLMGGQQSTGGFGSNTTNTGATQAFGSSPFGGSTGLLNQSTAQTTQPNNTFNISTIGSSLTNPTSTFGGLGDFGATDKNKTQLPFGTTGSTQTSNNMGASTTTTQSAFPSLSSNPTSTNLFTSTTSPFSSTSNTTAPSSSLLSTNNQPSTFGLSATDTTNIFAKPSTLPSSTTTSLNFNVGLNNVAGQTTTQPQLQHQPIQTMQPLQTTNVASSTGPSGAAVYGLLTNTPADPILPSITTSEAQKDPFIVARTAVMNAASKLYGKEPPTHTYKPCLIPKFISRPRVHKYISRDEIDPQTPPALHTEMSIIDPVTPTSGFLALPTAQSRSQTAFIPIRGPIETTPNVHNGPKTPPALSEPLVQSVKLQDEDDPGESADEEDLPIFTRTNYICKPSIEALRQYSKTKLANVEDFTVTREGFGSITWLGLTDIRGLDIDAIVHIEDRAVEVYGSLWIAALEKKGVINSKEPTVGEGLNKPARITLYNCRPGNNMIPRKQISEELMKMHTERLRQYTQDIGGEFEILKPDFTWIFRVEHFSRYAMPFCESEASNLTRTRKTNSKKQQLLRRRGQGVTLRKKPPTNDAAHGSEGKAKFDGAVLNAPDLVRMLKPQDYKLEDRQTEEPTLTIVIESATEIFAEPTSTIVPINVGTMLLRLPQTNETLMVASIWAHDDDLLGAVVDWSIACNRQPEVPVSDDLIHMLLSGDIFEASMHCLNAHKLPRLAMLISTLEQPYLGPQAKVVEQLKLYLKKEAVDQRLNTLLQLIGGVVTKELLHSLSTWKQCLTAVLLFELNVNFIRSYYPTYEDQIPILRNALTRLDSEIMDPQMPRNSPLKQMDADPSWHLLKFIALHGDSDNVSVKTYLGFVLRNRDLIVPGWFAQLHGFYCTHRESTMENLSKHVSVRKLFAQELKPAIAKMDISNGLIWTLVKYVSESCTNRQELIDRIAIAVNYEAADGVVPPGRICRLTHILPAWFVYRCLAEKCLSLGDKLRCARYHHLCGLEVEYPKDCDSSWWQVLSKTNPTPSIAEAYALSARSLSSGNYMKNTVSCALACVEIPKPLQKKIDLEKIIPTELLDGEISVPFNDLISALDAHYKLLEMQETLRAVRCEESSLSGSEREFMRIWREADGPVCALILEWITGLMEFVVEKNRDQYMARTCATLSSIIAHTNSTSMTTVSELTNQALTQLLQHRSIISEEAQKNCEAFIEQFCS